MKTQPSDSRLSTARSYSLTPMQVGMVAAGQGDSGVYIQQLVVRFEAAQNLEHLERAWDQLVQICDALRLRVVKQANGYLGQVVDPSVSVPFEVLLIDEEGFEKRLAQFLTEDRISGFDWEQPPYMRVSVIDQGAEGCVMVWTSHHLLFDGRSRVLLLKMFFALLEGNETKPLPSAIPFYTWLGERKELALELFWCEKLKGFVPPQARVEVKQTCELHQAFSRAETNAFQQFASSHGVNLHTLAQAAWAIMLSRYTDSTDVVFGSVRAGRKGTVPQADEMVGLFVHTLPLRIQVDESTDVVSFLQYVRQCHLELRAVEHTPLSLIQQWSGVPVGAPLFDSIVGYTYESLESAYAKHQFSGRYQLYERTGVPLSLAVEGGACFRFRLEYSESRCSCVEAGRMMGHLTRVLHEFMETPTQSLREIDMLTTAEHVQLLDHWSGINQQQQSSQTVVEKIRQQIQLRPDGMALVCGDLRWTYEELHNRANQISYSLKQFNVQSDDCVGIYLERSPDCMATIWAILMAGAAYMPIDHEYPPNRIVVMLEDAAPKVIVTRSAFTSKLDEMKQTAQILNLDELDCNQAHLFPDNPTPIARDHLAYVLFTSGSTGRPKGVMVEHGALANHLEGFITRFSLHPEDRILQYTSLGFDPSVEQVLATWSAGATLVMRGEEVWGPEQVHACLSREKLTIMNFPQRIWSLWVDYVSQTQTIWPGQHVRLILCGGEVMPREAAACWLQAPQLSRIQLVNLYGPTETTITATDHTVTQRDLERRVPIGRPTSHALIYILDRNRRLCPPGVEGELYIGGSRLARGYIGQPDQTSARFLINPFISEGGRMYATGDRACFLEDGVIDFLGRADGQVKFRGFRLELEEVEAVLKKVEGVVQSVVLRIGEPGSEAEYLTACVVLEADFVLDVKGLKSRLAESLPHYMIPDHMVAISEVPVNAHGKVDRRVLAGLPEVTQRIMFAGEEEPFSEDEQKLAAIWQAVLGVESSSRSDNFLERGGHSLLAMRLGFSIYETFSVEFPLHRVFERPVFSEQWEAIQGLRQDQKTKENNPDRVANTEKSYPLSPSQFGLWKLQLMDLNERVYNISRIIRLTGAVDLEALQNTYQYFISKHDSFRTYFTTAPFAIPEQRVVSNLEAPLIVHECEAESLEESRNQASQIAEELCCEPFDLAVAPLFRNDVVRIASDEYLLVIRVHHIVTDGLSLASIYSQMKEVYEAYAQGKVPNDPSRSEEYADYVDWLFNDYRKNTVPERSAYWEERLANARPGFEMPLDTVRPPVQTYTGDRFQVELPGETYRAIRYLASQVGASEFMTLVSVFHLLMREATGDTDTVIGVPVGNRVSSRFSTVNGLFMNMLPIRIESHVCKTFLDLLRQVRTRSLEAYARQDYPLEWLIEDLGLKKDLSQALFWQTRYNQLPELQRDSQWGLVKVEWLDRDEIYAKSDLTIYCCPKNGGGSLEFVYNTKLFRRQTIEEYAGRFLQLLEAILSDPNHSIADLLDPQYRRQVATSVSASAPLSSEVNSELRSLWRDILRVEKFEANQALFDLGADSLQVVQLAAAMSKALNRPISVPELVHQPRLMQWASERG